MSNEESTWDKITPTSPYAYSWSTAIEDEPVDMGESGLRQDEALRRMGIGYTAIEPVRTAFKSRPQTFLVKTPDGPYCLRRLPGSDDQFLLLALEHLSGFDGVCGVVGQPVMVDGVNYILTEWIEGSRQPRLKLTGDAALVGHLLARFHIATRGLVAELPGSWRGLYRRFPSYASRVIERIRDLHQALLPVQPRTQFDLEFLRLYPRVMRLADHWFETSHQCYLSASAEAERAQGFVHGDAHPGNILLAGQRAVLVDIECWHREVFIYDLYQLLRTQGFDQEVFGKVVRAYCQIRDITPAEKEALRSLCRFPGAPINTILGYYRGTRDRRVEKWVQDLKRQVRAGEEVNRIISTLSLWPWERDV